MSKARIAIYPGSLILTNGHLDIIRRGAGLFERSSSPSATTPPSATIGSILKRAVRWSSRRPRALTFGSYRFRGSWFRRRVSSGRQPSCAAFALADFDAEFRNGLANRDLSGMETLFCWLTQRTFRLVNLVKEIASNGGDVDA